MTKEFFVIKNGKGLIVQTWNFAPKPFINYCKSPEWAMKFETEAKAKERLDYFFKNKFHNLFEMKIVKIQETHFYKEIKNDSDRNPQGKTAGNLR